MFEKPFRANSKRNIDNTYKYQLVPQFCDGIESFDQEQRNDIDRHVRQLFDT